MHGIPHYLVGFIVVLVIGEKTLAVIESCLLVISSIRKSVVSFTVKLAAHLSAFEIPVYQPLL